jgi:hypothetical protein
MLRQRLRHRFGYRGARIRVLLLRSVTAAMIALSSPRHENAMSVGGLWRLAGITIIGEACSGE